VRVNELVVFFCRRAWESHRAAVGASVFGRELPVGFAVALQKMIVLNCDDPTQFG
jgi:hypothetical protein